VLEGFEEAFEIWVAQESPNDALRLLVLDWLFTRLEDPFVGVRRQPSFENLWFGPVPGTVHGPGQVVVCSYWIFESSRTIRCDSIATLSLPL